MAQDLADHELDELCRILIGADRDRLIEAIERLQERGQFVDWQSQTLADAMRLALARDPSFKESMGTMISQGVHSTVERDSAAFGRALAPAMGPAIRNAVWMMLQGFVQSIEAVVDQQLSWRSVRWRFEAWRTGRSFAEIAFVHTLLFRVEHVFLVHRDNGIQLLHATRPGVIARQPDLIAAMLTAIQDFVRDAFAESPGDGNDNTATSFAVGDLNVVVENGNHAALAAVVRGQARAEIQLQLRDSLDRIETNMAHALGSFDGETDQFEAVRPQVESCLLESQRAGDKQTKKKKKSGGVRWALIGAAIALLTWYVIAAVAAASHHERLTGFVAALRTEPGFVVTDVDIDGDQLTVRGMRDPLARDFETLKGEHHVEPFATGEWQPYHALHPDFVTRRLNGALAPPKTVAIELQGTTLRMTGKAPHEWLTTASGIARTMAGIDAVDASGCEDIDVTAWHETAAHLLAFDPGVQALSDPDGKERREFTAILRRLTTGAIRIHRSWKLEAEFVWWTADEGSPTAQRARTLVADLSREHGIDIPLARYVGDTAVKEATLRLRASLLE